MPMNNKWFFMYASSWSTTSSSYFYYKYYPISTGTILSNQYTMNYANPHLTRIILYIGGDDLNNPCNCALQNFNVFYDSGGVISDWTFYQFMEGEISNIAQILRK